MVLMEEVVACLENTKKLRRPEVVLI
jgi:hypothetical protein